MRLFDIPDVVRLITDRVGCDDGLDRRLFVTFLGDPLSTRDPFETMDRNKDPPKAALHGNFEVVKWLYT